MPHFCDSLYDRRMGRPRVLLVHGSVVNGDVTWAAQAPLADRFELVVPNRRGFTPGPDVDRVDFEDEAAWLERFLDVERAVLPGAGHSVQRLGAPFNDVLASFVERAEQNAALAR